MKSIGVYLLAPETIWKRSHEHHHNNNSKLTITGIGSYPTISKDRYLRAYEKAKVNLPRLIVIRINHCVRLFYSFYLLVKSEIIFPESFKAHVDSLLALLLHGASSICNLDFFGRTSILSKLVSPLPTCLWYWFLFILLPA